MVWACICVCVCGGVGDRDGLSAGEASGGVGAILASISSLAEEKAVSARCAAAASSTKRVQRPSAPPRRSTFLQGETPPSAGGGGGTSEARGKGVLDLRVWVEALPK